MRTATKAVSASLFLVAIMSLVSISPSNSQSASTLTTYRTSTMTITSTSTSLSVLSTLTRTLTSSSTIEFGGLFGVVSYTSTSTIRTRTTSTSLQTIISTDTETIPAVQTSLGNASSQNQSLNIIEAFQEFGNTELLGVAVLGALVGSLLALGKRRYGRKAIITKQTPLSERDALDNDKRWDVFICHASEDKSEIARPLAEALSGKNLKVWFDEFTLRLGDSLGRTIDAGLANSRFGVVILSPSFFMKNWPRKELDGLAAREDGKQKVILPIWHKIQHGDVLKFSPTLADRYAVSTSEGLDLVVDAICDVVLPRRDGTES